ncbi:calcium-binding protein [Nostoc sp.]
MAEYYGTYENDFFGGTLENDIAYGSYGDDYLYGSDGDDTLFGDEGNDQLVDEQGDDLLYGGSGNDRLYGVEGNNTLYGGSGNDTLIGGYGMPNNNNTLYGDAGSDTFSYNTYYLNSGNVFDTIGDFEVGYDKIDVANTSSTIPISSCDFSYDSGSGILSFQNNPFIYIQNNPTGFNVANDLTLSNV